VCQAGLPVSASQPPLDSAFSSRFLTHVGPRNRCFAAGALRVLGKHQPLSIRLWIVPPDLHLRSGSYASFPGVLLVSSLLPKLPTFPEPGFAPRGTWLGVSLPRDDALVARGELWAARTPVRVASDSAPGSHPPIRAIDYSVSVAPDFLWPVPRETLTSRSLTFRRPCPQRYAATASRHVWWSCNPAPGFGAAPPELPSTLSGLAQLVFGRPLKQWPFILAVPKAQPGHPPSGFRGDGLTAGQVSSDPCPLGWDSHPPKPLPLLRLTIL
jgi:hypothetical protein